MKKCSKCGVVRPLEQFGRQIHTRDGKTAHCRECIRKKSKSDRDKIKEENKYFIE